MKKNIIIKLFIGIIIFTLGLVIGNITKTPNTKIETKVITKEKEVNLDKRLKEMRKKENIIFLGDSITDFYPIDDIFLNLPIVNSGISGYRTTNILEEMDEMVYRYNPTKVFLLIGTNDLNDEEPEKVEENIVKIVENIQKNRAKAKIYVESIYPVNKSIDSEVVSNRNNEKIKEVNDYIKSYCENNKVTYIDVYSMLADEDGNFNHKSTDDGLHANKLGYARISQVLINYLYDL